MIKPIKFIAGAAFGVMLGGGITLAADLPSVSSDECALVSVVVSSSKEPTFVEPDPAATAMDIVVYCGHQVTTANSSGGTSTRTERSLKVLPVDAENAELIVGAAVDLLDDDGDVWLP